MPDNTRPDRPRPIKEVSPREAGWFRSGRQYQADRLARSLAAKCRTAAAIRWRPIRGICHPA
jgi:hypothetical protein